MTGRGEPRAAPAHLATALWAAAAMALLVAPAALLPGGELVESREVWGPDKLVHALLCAGLALLAARSLRLAGLASARLGGALLATGWGALAELLQVLVPSRSAELGDLLANALGAALAIVTTAVLERRSTAPRVPGPRPWLARATAAAAPAVAVEREIGEPGS